MRVMWCESMSVNGPPLNGQRHRHWAKLARSKGISRGVGHRLHADRYNSSGVLPRIDDCDCLFRGAGHGLFDVDVLARGEGIAGHLPVPVVRGGDAHRVHVWPVEYNAVILRDALLVR